MKNVDYYFHQVCNQIYCHIECTGCVFAGDGGITWITCCAWDLLCCFQEIQYVRPTASLWPSKSVLIYLNIQNWNYTYFYFVWLIAMARIKLKANLIRAELSRRPTGLSCCFVLLIQVFGNSNNLWQQFINDFSNRCQHFLLYIKSRRTNYFYLNLKFQR